MLLSVCAAHTYCLCFRQALLKLWEPPCIDERADNQSLVRSEMIAIGEVYCCSRVLGVRLFVKVLEL